MSSDHRGPTEDPSGELETLVGEWLTLPEAAGALRVEPGRLRQWVRERELVAVRAAGWSRPRVPAACLADGHIVKGLGGTLTVLADSGFDDDEAVRWLFTADESLPGRPIDALHEDRGKEVRRRAQALAL